jgi:hypothetical protein
MIQPKYGILYQRDQEEVSLSQELAQMLETFLWPLLVVLDKYIECAVSVRRR